MKICKAQAQDAEALYKIEAENYGPQEATALEDFKYILKNPDEHSNYSLMGLHKDESLIGFYCPIEIEDIIHLVDIALAKEHQGKGLGIMLLAHLIKNAKFPVKLKVREDNKVAMGLYLHFGFKEMARLENYYGDCDGLEMQFLP